MKLKSMHPAFDLRRLRFLWTGLVLGSLPLLSGCVVVAAGAAGAGAVAYVRGQLEANLDHDLDAVFKASQRAMAKMEFAKIDDHKSRIDAQLVSRTALDKKVEIRLQKVTDRLTKVQIRVGLIGDQELSMLLLEKIKAELK
jgi:hypothetical protein